jgi:putative ABC transport system ATP-binding protein
MLELRDLHKTFNAGTPNEMRSLQGVSLTLEEGSFVMVLGTNGSGKSTLLNAVAGSFMIDAGSIRLDDHDMTRWPEHKRAQYIGRVFQNPFSGTAANLTIAENLALASRRGLSRGLGLALGSSQRESMREVVAGLGMGLEGRLDNIIGSLSGGQRQAITLLMATLVKPRLLMLDEHTAALDPKSADQVIRITDRVVTRDRLTTLMVTHSMAQAVSLGDRLIMMHRGRIIADLSGAQKRRLRADDLLARFEDVRRADLLDPSAASLLQDRYV